MLQLCVQDHSWSRRCSTETVFSIQGKETDYARDSSDTDTMPAGGADDSDLEYEPVTESDDDEDNPLDENSSAESDNNIIATKVIEVAVGDDGELQFADSEQTEPYETDADEIDKLHYRNCVQCNAWNIKPQYRYCQKCFQVRKNFFPPRPQNRRKIRSKIESIKKLHRDISEDLGEIQGTLLKKFKEIPPNLLHSLEELKRAQSEILDQMPPILSQDSGVDSPNSQDLLDNPGEGTSNPSVNLVSRRRKRVSDFPESNAKRSRISHTDSEADVSSDDSKSVDVVPLQKTISDPSITIEEVDVKVTKKVIANSLIEKMDGKDLCVVCVSEPKSGAFVHGRIAHICCCYKCAVKVWAKTKRCPLCNCKVSNVLKAIIM